MQRAAELSEHWHPDDVLAALAQHPKIGERTTNAHSVHEQADVDGSDTALAKALEAGNQRYEATFGRLFLIRAAGRDGQAIDRA